MIQSMTGYGKAETLFGKNKIVVEIRSVNGKNADISLKTSLIPREKEMEVRQLISQKLQRGNIDLFTTIENGESIESRSINKDIFKSYFEQISSLKNEIETLPSDATILSTILRLPDVIEVVKKENDEKIWNLILPCVNSALDSMISFRKTEGKKLEEDIRERVSLIFKYIDEVEVFEEERKESVKQRLISRFEEVGVAADENRFEQELIYYLEKLDITEEKVRLRQHCKYFLETIDNEEFPGKKIGFISQEMGREINTMGSKANHAEIQRRVVMMKDELEKIKEQSLNIL